LFLAGSFSGAEIAYRTVRPEAAAGNLLKNAGFEDSETNGAPWQRYDRGFVIDGAVVHAGRRSIKVVAPDAAGTCGASYRLELNQPRPVPIAISGWSKAQDVSGGSDTGYALYLDAIYNDDSPQWGVTARFATGSHDWERAEMLFVPAKPVKQLSLYCLFRGHSGTAWFDDIALAELGGKDVVMLDFTPVTPEPLPPRAQPRHSLVFASSGISIELDSANGLVTQFQSAKQPLRSSGAASGWMLMDVAARSDFCRANGRMKAPDGLYEQHSAIEPLNIELDATYSMATLHGDILFTCKATDTSGKDRAINLIFALPVDLVGWTWWDDLNRSRKIEAGSTYQNTTPVDVGKVGALARYPLAAVTGPEHGLAIAVPLDKPRIFRTQYDAVNRCLLIAFDFALSPDARKSPQSASVEFILYRFDPQWGFRAALEKYYSIYADHFAKRVPKEGIWMAFAPISKVQQPEDFGFVFKEGDGEVPYDDEHGYLTFRYTEPQTFWQRMDKAVPRTYDGCIEVLQKSLTSSERGQKASAQATAACGLHDQAGRYRVWTHDTPWCDGCVFALNPDPDLPGEVTKAKLNYTPEDADRRYGPGAKGTLDGEYLDSLEGWGEHPNYRREHFASVDVPLVYDTAARRTCILNAFSIHEFTRYIADDVHHRGKLMMANATPMGFYWFAHCLDVMGQEMNWKREGRYQPPPEEELAFRRAICGTKPYLILQNTVLKDFAPEDSRRYMMHAAFWGFFPSFFSADASTDHYFSNPAYYNRDRQLFKQIIPVIQRIAKAGWEPVTLASVQPAELRIERFGRLDTGDLHFTVLNPTDRPQRAAVSIALDVTKATDLWTGKPIPVTPRETPALAIDVPPGESVVVWVQR
jgi:hypothetical protein